MRNPSLPRPSRASTGGLLAVLAALLIAAGPAALPAIAAEPATLTLQASIGPDGTVRLTVLVVDAKGAPAADASVDVKTRTVFGWLPVGRVSTDAAGRAQLDLPAASAPGEFLAEVGGDGRVRAILRLGQRKPLEPQVRPGREILGELSPQPGFISPYPVPLQVALLAVVLGGIWTAYGYVAWLLGRIRSARDSPAAGKPIP
jgi:hypothetical protein